MNSRLIDVLKKNPVIASVKDEDGLRKVLLSKNALVFVLFGNICNIASIVQRIHQAEKVAMVHIDLIEGTSSKEIVVDYLKNTVKADGIISSKASILKVAKQKNLYTIHRFFLIDSLSYSSLPKQYANSQADVIEIMPGCIVPKVLKWVQMLMKVPVIASGMICEQEDALNALRSGVVAISSTNPDVWETKYKTN